MPRPISPLSARSTAPAQTAERAKMQQVARQFEAVFARQMIGAMRGAGPAEGDGLFDSGASQQFRDMADARTADSMAGTGGLGIASMLMRQYDAQHPSKPSSQAKSVTTPVVDPGK